jgi:hypothetical protein
MASCTLDARRRDSKVGGPFAQNGDAGQSSGVDTSATQQISPLDDEPASPLQNAKLLNDLNADVRLNYKNLEHMNELQPTDGTVYASARFGRCTARAPTSAGSSSSMGYAKLNGEFENVVSGWSDKWHRPNIQRTRP